MRRLRIAYVGCGLAGKRSSLSSVLATRGRETRVAALGSEDHELAWPGIGGGMKQLVIFAAIMRAWLRPTPDAAPSPEVTDERRRLGQVDGLIFVIDSQEARDDANIEHLNMLSVEMADLQRDVQAIPIVFQANKRDLPKIRSMSWIREHFQAARCTHTESVATRGIGTADAVEALLKLMN